MMIGSRRDRTRVVLGHLSQLTAWLEAIGSQRAAKVLAKSKRQPYFPLLQDTDQAWGAGHGERLFENCGDKPRSFRNGLALAVPHKEQVEILRRACATCLPSSASAPVGGYVHYTIADVGPLGAGSR
jgi:hypothetical protein